MKKITLDLGTLQVESFIAAGPLERGSTVQARQVTPDPDCAFSFDYGYPCGDSDPGGTCANTCPQTCPGTCGTPCTSPAACQDPI